MVFIGCPLVFGVSECRLKVSVLRLPVGNGLECAVFGKLPRAAFGLGKQCGGFRVGFGDVGEADDAEVVGVVGVFVGFVAAEETPAAVVFKNGGFAVKEADGPVLFGDGVGGDAAVECRGKCLCKCVHCGNTLGGGKLADFTTIPALSADGGGLVVQCAPFAALRCFCIFGVWKRIRAVFCGRR